MNTVKYLAVSEAGAVRVVAKPDSVRGYEIPIKLTLSIPEHYWETPLCSANITLPDAPDELQSIAANIAFTTNEIDKDENLDDI